MITVDAEQLIRENLGIEMEKQGLNQSELSRRSGVRQATISEILSGKTTPTIQALQRLAKALQIAPAQFFLEPPVKSA